MASALKSCPDTHMGDSDRVLVFWLQPSLALATADIWEINLLCLSSEGKQTLQKKKKAKQNLSIFLGYTIHNYLKKFL